MRGVGTAAEYALRKRSAKRLGACPHHPDRRQILRTGCGSNWFARQAERASNAPLAFNQDIQRSD
jgi:hypothetical protein